MMIIANYADFFHDGSITEISQSGNNIEISMQSAEVHEEDLKDPIVLSKYHRIKGKLHLEGVKRILDNNQELFEKVRMLYDSGGILHLEIKKDCVKLDLEWRNYPPHPKVVAYSFYEIKAEKIWRENIPDLFDPFW